MGSGIAQICATAGYRTIVREVNEPLVNPAFPENPFVVTPARVNV